MTFLKTSRKTRKRRIKKDGERHMHVTQADKIITITTIENTMK